MNLDIFTLFPEAFDWFRGQRPVRKAIENGASLQTRDYRNWTPLKGGRVDDAPYGGGAGMVIQCQPVFDCIESLLAQRTYDEVIFLCPDGERLDQSICNGLSTRRNLILLAGHYKGIDQRIRDVLITREISVGDYVLTGGELAAAVLTDAVVRLVPGVVGDAESVLDDSFMHGLLDPPLYTKPAEFRGKSVPDVLLSGDHARQMSSTSRTGDNDLNSSGRCVDGVFRHPCRRTMC